MSLKAGKLGENSFKLHNHDDVVLCCAVHLLFELFFLKCLFRSDICMSILYCCLNLT